VVDVNNQGNVPPTQIISFTCQNSSSPSTQTIFYASGYQTGTFTNDLAFINLTATGLSFNQNNGNVFARTPTSSPVQADIGLLFAIGFGESVPNGQPSPVLQYVQLNPVEKHICNNKYNAAGLLSTINLNKDNFCLSGFVKSPKTGFLTDACVLDRGGAIIRTSNIGSPYADHEVVGIINSGTCADVVPVVASYLWVYTNNGFLPSQGSSAPIAGSPVNPNAKYGNFVCGNGNVEAGVYEQCDPSSGDPNAACCNTWTCKLEQASTPCTLNNRNGTKCRQQPRCNKLGECQVKFRNQGKRCASSRNTRCHRGKCCTYPGAVNCQI